MTSEVQPVDEAGEREGGNRMSSAALVWTQSKERQAGLEAKPGNEHPANRKLIYINVCDC